MSQATKLHIATNKLVSAKDVLHQLESLDKQLKNAGLEQFMTFNKAYYIVTRTIAEASDRGFFDNPRLIETFSVCFARYYFEAVNESLAATSSLPAAWAKMNNLTKRTTLPNFILLLMGANAHINYDLPLALLETVGQQKTENVLGDILKVDKLLMKSGREIINVFDESNRLVNFVKKHLVFLYYRPIMYIILFWRIKAWNSYRALKNDDKNRSQYKTRSLKIANRLIKLGEYLR